MHLYLQVEFFKNIGGSNGINVKYSLKKQSNVLLIPLNSTSFQKYTSI